MKMNDIECRTALSSLEQFMYEFFAPTTTNTRKQEIERALAEFPHRRDAHLHCLYFLQHTQNEYVLMYTLTTLESLIARQWWCLSQSERYEIRLQLWRHLNEKHQIMPYFIRNKMATLIVAIAMFDWPHDYPNFFTDIVDLINHGGSSSLLGVIIAHAASEELGAVREGALVLSSRRKELNSHMLRGAPQLLQALAGILEKYANKEISGLSAGLPDLVAVTRHADLPEKSLISEIILKCLSTLQHLFSWLPLSSHVPPTLVTTVFHWGSAITQPCPLEICCVALGAVSELLYRRYAPPSSAACALRLHHHTLRLLRPLTQPNTLASIDELYLTKLTEFLRLFVSLHFKRLEAEPEFDAVEFLSYIFQYTFQVPTCSLFVDCLDIWTQFMDSLKPEDVNRYSDALIGLANGVLNKMQFQNNKAQLEHLDDENMDDDGETEWQTFLKRCIDCLTQIADFIPLPVFTLVMEAWSSWAGVVARCGGRAVGDRARAALRDLASLTATLPSLVPALVAGSYYAESEAALERIAGALGSASVNRPHCIAHTTDAPLLMKIHGSLASCAGAWVSCSSAQNVLPSLLTHAARCLMPLSPPEPAVITVPCARLVLTSVKCMKLADFSTHLSDLYQQSLRSLQYLDEESAELVREAIARVLVRGGAAGERALASALRSWASCGFASGGAANRSGAKRRWAVSGLSRLISSFSDASAPDKKILTRALEESVSGALKLLEDGDMSAELAELFVTLFSSLLPQLGNSFTQTSVRLLLHQATASRNETALQHLVTCLRLSVEFGTVSCLPDVMSLLLSALPNAVDHDLNLELYQLAASILIHRWRYFFPASCTSGETTRPVELRALIGALGRALTAPHVELYRLNLNTLQKLDTKWRLYHKAIFRCEFLGDFLTVLLSAVVDKRPLRDETIQALHALASVDFATFRGSFLPHYLSQMPHLTQVQKESLADFSSECDLPTFTQNIQNLANDIYCYQTCNSHVNSLQT